MVGLPSQRGRWWLVPLFAVLGACSAKPPPPNPVPVEPTGCPLSFSYRPKASASRVSVMGEWNGFDRLAHPMADEDGDGTWSITLRAKPGTWAYSFLENGNEVVDPEAQSVRYVDGRPMSALRISDCALPSIEVRKGSVSNTRPSVGKGDFKVVLGLSQGKVEGTVRLPDGSSRALSAGEITAADGLATVHLTNLPDGKYTISVQATNDGKTGEPLLLPFWIEAEPFSFVDSPLYMLVTDRFRDGDPSNNVVASPNVPFSVLFQGGDLQGVEQAIREGYFDNLGVRAIWLTPWQTQPQGTFSSSDNREVSGYHGYWPVKAREIDPRFGNKQSLHSLVTEAHRHGIRIVMDAVLNHVHSEHEYFKDPAKKAWFRTGCVCDSSPSCGFDTARLTCLFTTYMPDINWTNNEASDQFVADTLWWMEEFDLDGLRLDAVKQIEESAFIQLTGRVRERFEQAGTEYYMFGETFSGDVPLIKSYMGPRALNGQLNFPLFFNVPEPVFGRDDLGLQRVKDATQTMINDFGAAAMVNFVGNHDVARFITKADPTTRDRQGSKWDNLPGAPSGQLPYDRLFLAMTNLMTIPGVPLIYYGDEYGEFGGADPDNRHMLNREATLWAPQQGQLARMRTLLRARAELRGLRRGPMLDLWCNEEAWGAGKGNLYAYARPDSDPHQSAVVVLNLTTNTWTGVVVRFPPQLAWSSGSVRDALTQRSYSVNDSTVTVDVPARGAVLLRLQ
jgi:glycosidase